MLRWILILVLVPCSAAAQTMERADEIMARVAAHQDRAVEQRSEYVYQQRIRIISRKTNGRMMRDETTDYLVTPTPDGTKKELKSVAGRAWVKGRYVEFNTEPGPNPDSLDKDLVDDLRDDMANDRSKDGLARDLFPLTTDEQKEYGFELDGEATIDGRHVCRIRFSPRDRHDIGWAGEALIDCREYQPLRVYTKLSRKLPIFIRTVFGTSLPGIGFDVEYQRFGDGVWFPASFGTEFRLRAVFFIKRDISISLRNSGFERAHVKSKLLDYTPVH
ncbi:MAG TPA: hypothetical protein VJW77_13795 [Terriglobia bacterium]|nr:hypothetical protein [Terriglobia bacterium]